MYGVLYKLGESRNSAAHGPLSFPSTEERKAFVKGPTVYWYHLVEEEDWHLWLRGGAWAATAVPGPADAVPDLPEITEDDRW
jgi:hypothetical protein